MTHDPFHIPPYRERCSHCDAAQPAGYSWYSDGHGAIYCERCMARAVELLRNERSVRAQSGTTEYTLVLHDLSALTRYLREKADHNGW